MTPNPIPIHTGFRLNCSERELEWLATMERFHPLTTVPPTLPKPTAKPGLLARLTRLFSPSQAAIAPPPQPESLQTTMAAVSVSDQNLEYLREPPAGVEKVHGWLGRSPNHTAIIICRYTLEVVPLDHITGLVLDRIRPGRGGGEGYSTLSLDCVPPYAQGIAKQVLLTQASGMSSLDQLAKETANWLTRPCRTTESIDD